MQIRKRLGFMIALFALLVPLFLSGQAPIAEAAEETQRVTLHNLKFDQLPAEEQNTGDLMSNFQGDPLPGSVYTAYDVTDTYWKAYNAESGAHDKKEAAGITAAEKADISTATNFVFPETDQNGLAKVDLPIKSGDDNAIYLIKQTEFPEGVIQAKSKPFVIGLPSHKDDGTVSGEVHVYPKNEYATNDLIFRKYGVDEKGDASVLKDALFILKKEGGNYFNSGTNQFDIVDEKNATKIPSDAKGDVKLTGVVLAPGTYEFYEVESSVATGEKQTGPKEDELFHFIKNPAVIVTVSTEGVVTKYEYYDQNSNLQSIAPPVSEDNIAKAYNFKVPEIKKTVDDEKVEQGQIVSYTISQKIPEDITDYTMYNLIDTYDKRLELCCSEADIKGSIQIDGQPVVLAPTYSAGANTFTLAFKPGDLASYAKKTLTFVATMRVKTGTDLSFMDNDVTFENNFRDETDKKQIITYGKKFVKVDNKTDKQLAGAEFVIKQGARFLQLLNNNGEKITSITGDDCDYTVKWVANETDATKLISNSEGRFGIYGLDSNVANYYTLVETKSPDGYVGAVELKFTADDCTSPILKVGNKAKGILPMTGGMGTSGLLVVGLVGLAAGIGYFRKRKVMES